MFKDISFDDDQMRLLEYLGDVHRETHLRQLATKIIWNEANGGLKPPGMNVRLNFLMKMGNAKGWADHYQASTDWFLATNPDHDRNG